MKKIVLLGVTGSIGMQTVDVCKNHPNKFSIVAVSAGRNIKQLESLLEDIEIKYVCTIERQLELEKKYPQITFFYGDQGLIQLAALEEYDILVNALVGFSGLKPTLTAIENKKDIALANKETLVVAGQFVKEALEKNQVKMYPIDSEHSAIFQCLQGSNQKEVRRIILTASGGSFRDKTRDELKGVTCKQALAHPNWSMGAKITIDSATMMNKGFEVIEAHWFYDVPFDKIEVLLHPQSIVHSMVEFHDLSILAQLGVSDMRIPIQYALSYPERYEGVGIEAIDFKKMRELNFEEVSFERFPLLKLAFDVGKKQGSLPAILNAANEVANQAFLDGRISFLEIESYVIDACENLPYRATITLDDIYEIDRETREYVENRIRGKV